MVKLVLYMHQCYDAVRRTRKLVQVLLGEVMD